MRSGLGLEVQQAFILRRTGKLLTKNKRNAATTNGTNTSMGWRMFGNAPRIVQVLKYFKHRTCPATLETAMMGRGGSADGLVKAASGRQSKVG